MRNELYMSSFMFVYYQYTPNCLLFFEIFHTTMAKHVVSKVG